MLTESSVVLHPPEMSRAREPNQRLLWLFHVTFSKLTPDLRENEWTASRIGTFGRTVWKACQEHGCISFGGAGGSAWDEINLVSETPGEARQLRILPNMTAGDVVVATLGNRMLGWGVVRARKGKAYHWRPKTLKSLRGTIGRKFARSRFWWFSHVVWVDWTHHFGRSGVEMPSAIPLQPTVRWPKTDNAKAWHFLKEHGVPVDEKGQVTATPVSNKKRRNASEEE